MQFPLRSLATEQPQRLQRAFKRFNPNRPNSLQWHAEHPMPRPVATVELPGRVQRRAFLAAKRMAAALAANHCQDRRYPL